MNHLSTLSFWTGLLGLLALEISLIIAVVATWQRLVPLASRRRVIWQAGLLGAAMLLLFETTGLGRGVAHWALWKLRPQPIARSANNSHIPPAQAYRQTPLSAKPTTADKSPAPVDSLYQPGGMNTVMAPVPGITWWPALIWLAGAGLVLAWVAASHVLLLVFRWRHSETGNAMLRERVRLLAWHLKLRRRVTVMESTRLTSPIAFGVFRPVICVPVNFPDAFSEEEQNAMITHELAHLMNRDPAWYLLSDLVLALLWWHPLVWWARRQVHAASETAADEACLILQDGPTTLAGCLVAVGRRLSEPPPLGWLGMAGNGFKSGLGQRVERLLNLDGQRFKPLRRGQAWVAKALGSLALAALAVLCTASATLPAFDRPMANSLRASWDSSVAGQTVMAALGTDNPMALMETKSKPVEQSAVAMRLAQVGKKTNDTERSKSATLPVPNPYLRTNLIHTSAERQKLKAKLDSIVCPEVFFDGLPLSEVVKFLYDESRRLDPEKRGVNIFINAIVGEAGATTAANGRFDPNQAMIKINPPLQNLTLGQVLDAVAKASDHPLRVSLEDYAVIFHAPLDGTAPLNSRTYRVDPNTFKQGLENVAPRVPAGGNQNNPGGQNNNSGPGAIGVNPAGPTSQNGGGANTPPSLAKQLILVKLDIITLPEVSFDGVLLSDAIKTLYDEVKRLDPEKAGVNFMVNALPNGSETFVNLVTGEVTDAMDMDDVTVKISPPLRNVTLAAAIDAIAKAADHPIQVKIEDHAVVFSQKVPEAPSIYTRVYQVNPVTFLDNLAREFGFKSKNELLVHGGAVGVSVLKDFLTRSGINLRTNAPVGVQIFFNDRNGLLMVRATQGELESIGRAIEKLDPTATISEVSASWQSSQIPATNSVPSKITPARTQSRNQTPAAPARAAGFSNRPSTPTGLTVAAPPTAQRRVPATAPIKGQPNSTKVVATATIPMETLRAVLQNPQVLNAVRDLAELLKED